VIAHLPAELAPEFARPVDSPHNVPSRRLLKILDPEGHLERPGPIADSHPAVVVWAGTTLRGWIADAVRRAGGTPQLATAFRHFAFSVGPSAPRPVRLAILDHASLSAVDASGIAAFRWSGYTGRLIVVSREPVDPHFAAVLQVDACVRPHDPAQPLETVIARHLR
jgi:hypothetical protein